MEQYVKGCSKCQESKTIWLPHTPLHHFNTPTEEGPFQYVSMDFITDLPKSKGYDTILTIVDQGCSKVTKFIPCNKEITREGVAELYSNTSSPGMASPNTSYLTETLDSIKTSSKHCAKPWGSNKTLKALLVILVGYEPNSKGYRLWDKNTHSVHLLRDMTFDKSSFPTKTTETELTHIGAPAPSPIPLPFYPVIEVPHMPAAPPLPHAASPTSSSKDEIRLTNYLSLK